MLKKNFNGKIFKDIFKNFAKIIFKCFQKQSIVKSNGIDISTSV